MNRKPQATDWGERLPPFPSSKPSVSFLLAKHKPALQIKCPGPKPLQLRPGPEESSQKHGETTLLKLTRLCMQRCRGSCQQLWLPPDVFGGGKGPRPASSKVAVAQGREKGQPLASPSRSSSSHSSGWDRPRRGTHWLSCQEVCRAGPKHAGAESSSKVAVFFPPPRGPGGGPKPTQPSPVIANSGETAEAS